MVKIKIEAPPEYDIVSKVGSIDFEYGVRGAELERELRKAQDSFLRAMELQGLTLYRMPGFNNPVWITSEDGEFVSWYAIDWEGKRIKKELKSGGFVEMTHNLETSLEDSAGMVEYRIVGVFWGPMRSIEILKSKDEIKAEEREARHPVIFGPAFLTGSSKP